jgi:hypothetical protein
MLVKNKKTEEDRAFWDHCEAVAAEVALWPAWMHGEVRSAVRSADRADKRYKEHVTKCEDCSRVDRHRGGTRCKDGQGLVRAAERERIALLAVKK